MAVGKPEGCRPELRDVCETGVPWVYLGLGAGEAPTRMV